MFYMNLSLKTQDNYLAFEFKFQRDCKKQFYHTSKLKALLPFHVVLKFLELLSETRWHPSTMQNEVFE